jgi:AraC-like DNA-binding protein
MQGGTLREGLQRYCRFFGFVTSAIRYELVEDGDSATIIVHEAAGNRDKSGFLGEWSANMVHKLAQYMISSKIWLDRTELTRALRGRFQDYALIFGSNVEFNCPQIRLTFARAILDRKILRSALPEVYHGNFSNPPLPTSWKDMAFAILRKDLLAGRPPSSIESLADQLAIGSQTLRRRLRAEGSGYRQLKAQVRREMALDLFSDRHTTVGEASIAAGFSEPNALTRALRGTLGVSSSQLRRQVETWGGERAVARTAGKPRD